MNGISGIERRGLAARCVQFVLLGLSLASCAIQPDSGPRDVPDDHAARVAVAPPVEGAAATGSGRIYLIAPEGSDQPLRSVLRDPKGQEELIATLIQGPNATELGAGLRSRVPAGLDVNSVQFDGGVVNVDVSDELEDLDDASLQLAVAQIVFTASELPGAESVLIRVDGDSRSWPDRDGDLQSDPLTVYDFIGYAESAQPAYPVTPRVPATTTTTTTTTTTSTTVPPATTG